jgi:hypothetical protein
MRTVGHRQPRPIGFAASAAQLAEGAQFNDEIHRLPSGNDSFIPKGVYRFKTHAEANQHQLDCLIQGMASIARARPQERLMEQHSHPASFDDLKSLIRALNQSGAEYLLIGGYALFAHGYHRATTDIALLVPANQSAGRKIREALLLLPDQAARDIDPAWFEEGDNIRVADVFVVDLMLNACGQTYDSLQRHAETIDLGGIPVRTVNLQGLLLTKQTARDKDVADRIVLERALAVLNARPEKS